MVTDKQITGDTSAKLLTHDSAKLNVKVEALAEKIWRGAGWCYPLKSASAHYQDQYRRIARFLFESGALEKMRPIHPDVNRGDCLQAYIDFVDTQAAAVDKLVGGK